MKTIIKVDIEHVEIHTKLRVLYMESRSIAIVRDIRSARLEAQQGNEYRNEKHRNVMSKTGTRDKDYTLDRDIRVGA